MTIRKELLEAGFDPETGFVIFAWDVEFNRFHASRVQKYIKRKLKWESKILDWSFVKMGWGDFIEGNRYPKERHRRIEYHMVARDAKALFIVSEYDGNEWITRIPITEEDLLQSEELPRS
jgi:hypothetical protein